MARNKKEFQRFKIIDGLLRSPKHYGLIEIWNRVNDALQQFEEDGEDLQVTDRQIRLDIKAIESIYGLEIENIGKKFWYKNKEDSIHNVPLNEEDKNVLALALQTFTVYKGSPFFEKFDDVITRVMAGSVLRKLHQRNAPNFIQIGEMTGDTGQEWLESIYQAISDKRCLKIHYNPNNIESKIRTISPYILKEYRNKWYMVAHAKEIKAENKTNLFKLFRIQKIELSDDLYYEDPNFDANEYFKYSLGVFHRHDLIPIEVELKFNKILIQLISENKLHSSMKILSKTEDEIIVSFKVYNTVELKTLILGFGSNVEVLSPLELKEEIIAELKKNLEMYQ